MHPKINGKLFWFHISIMLEHIFDIFVCEIVDRFLFSSRTLSIFLNLIIKFTSKNKRPQWQNECSDSYVKNGYNNVYMISLSFLVSWNSVLENKLFQAFGSANLINGEDNFIQSNVAFGIELSSFKRPSLEQFSLTLFCRLYPIPSSLECAYCFFQVFLFHFCFFFLLLIVISFSYRCAWVHLFRLTFRRLIGVLLCTNWIICGFISHKNCDTAHAILIHNSVLASRRKLCKFQHAFDRMCLTRFDLKLETNKKISTCGWHIGNAKIMFSNGVYSVCECCRRQVVLPALVATHFFYHDHHPLSYTLFYFLSSFLFDFYLCCKACCLTQCLSHSGDFILLFWLNVWIAYSSWNFHRLNASHMVKIMDGSKRAVPHFFSSFVLSDMIYWSQTKVNELITFLRAFHFYAPHNISTNGLESFPSRYAIYVRLVCMLPFVVCCWCLVGFSVIVFFPFFMPVQR